MPVVVKMYHHSSFMCTKMFILVHMIKIPSLPYSITSSLSWRAKHLYASFAGQKVITVHEIQSGNIRTDSGAAEIEFCFYHLGTET